MAEQKNHEDEEWKSIVGGPRGICRWDDKGERSTDVVEGGATFYITPYYRQRNALLCKDPNDNPFTNGSFKMLQAAEGDVNSQSMLDKVVVPDDDDLMSILDKPMAEFTKAVKAITEPVTAERLYRQARQNEVGPRKIKVAGDRLKELDPTAVVIGDKLGAGREDPDEGSEQSKVIDTDGTSGPREYAGLEN